MSVTLPARPRIDRIAQGTALRLMSIVDARRFGTRVFRWLGYVAAALALWSLWSIADRRVALAAAAFDVGCVVLFRLRQFRRMPAAIVLAGNVIVFLAIPIWYIGWRAPEFDFVERFGAPGQNSEYRAALPGAILSVTVYLWALVAGMIAGDAVSRRAGKRAPSGLHRRPLPRLVLLALFVAYVAMIDNSNFFAAVAQATARVNALLPLIFLDHAFLLLFPFLLYGAGASVAELRRAGPQLTFVAVVAIFMTVFLSATSKGAILNVSWYLFVFPLAYYFHIGGRIYWPSRPLIVIAALSALPLFFFAQTQRQIRMAGIEVSARDLAALVAREARDGSAQVFTAVADRISASFNNYAMIYARFGGNYDFGYANDFAAYIGRSFANLVWLGTPFPDAYLPSSQLLASVLDKAPLVGFGDAASFWVQANTQPYMAFGAGLILVGPWLLPVALAFAGFLFCIAFNHAPHMIVQLCLLFSLNAFFQVYGLEGTVQVVVHIAVASGIMLTLMSLPRFRIRNTRRLPVAPTGAPG